VGKDLTISGTPGSVIDSCSCR